MTTETVGILDFVRKYGGWTAYFVLHEKRRSFVEEEAVDRGLNQLHIRNLKNKGTGARYERAARRKSQKLLQSSRANL
jgi:hypothetical protein